LQEAKAAWEKANPGKTATLEDINGQIYQTAYNDALSASGFGTGGQYQQAIQAATAAVQGLAGSDLSAALAGGAAPYVAEVIGHYSDLNDAGKVAAHAVVNAALAAAQGQDALAGAAGAATGELVGMIALEMYGKSADKLDETQKQTVSALATLAAGLSGGLVGDSSASAVAGAQAGKTTVENNSIGDIAAALQQGKTTAQVAEEQVKAENERYKRENCGGMSAEACSIKMYTERREALKDAGLFGVDFVPIVGDIKGFAEAESAVDYLAAVIAIFPGLGDGAGKALKAAEKALAKGDLDTASKLIVKAGNDVSSAKYFGQERKFWTADPVEFKGNKVYQRNDLFDPGYIDPKSGKTNLELMQGGRAPIGTDGKPVNLHHMLQRQDGPIAEVTQSFHKDNHSTIHINDNSIPSGINRAQFNRWRSDYWKQRANDLK
uniref:HNH/ENDO VII family nuclease n=1 Tax=Leclercia sp. TaxID=1898428 RepID=UPI00289D2E5E